MLQSKFLLKMSPEIPLNPYLCQHSLSILWIHIEINEGKKTQKKENKRPMGHIAHLRKQFKSINTYDYIITLFKRSKKNNIINFMTINGSLLEQTWILFNLGCFVPSLVEIASASGEDFLISSMYFRYICNYLPLEKCGDFIWINLNPLQPRMDCVKFGWNWTSGSGEDFQISSM